MELYIGLISGTSMDGIDAALLDLNEDKFIKGLTVPYRQKTKTLLYEIINTTEINFSTFCYSNKLVGEDFAFAANSLITEVNIPIDKIKAIGSHGQTLYHSINKSLAFSLQIGCPHTIAEKTNIPVIADFRSRDIVNGGNGAPFAPIYHQHLFKSSSKPTVIINIGGITNISFITNDFVSGYDTGPGNCLLDTWIFQIQQNAYDDRGSFAASGQVIPELLEKLLADPYFSTEGPKSIGREYFSLQWLKKFLLPNYKANDVQATLSMLTVQTIVNAILSFQHQIKQIFICGGGVHNAHLLRLLKNHLPSIEISSTATMNIDPDFIEAAMFAWLAHKNVNKIPLDLTTITGSNKPAILGAYYPFY